MFPYSVAQKSLTRINVRKRWESNQFRFRFRSGIWAGIMVALLKAAFQSRRKFWFYCVVTAFQKRYFKTEQKWTSIDKCDNQKKRQRHLAQHNRSHDPATPVTTCREGRVDAAKKFQFRFLSRKLIQVHMRKKVINNVVTEVYEYEHFPYFEPSPTKLSSPCFTRNCTMNPIIIIFWFRFSWAD